MQISDYVHMDVLLLSPNNISILKKITHLKFELTSEWKRPHVSNLTAKSKGSAASPSCTVLLQLVSWAWPLTYITPWKLGSDTLTVTETPSAKQLTIISGRGKSLGGGLGLGMGTRKKGTRYVSSFYPRARSSAGLDINIFQCQTSINFQNI